MKFSSNNGFIDHTLSDLNDTALYNHLILFPFQGLELEEGKLNLKCMIQFNALSAFHLLLGTYRVAR